jgi:hypothetical protein
MTAQPQPGSSGTSAHSTALGQRLLALSGVAFAVLLVLSWFLSGGDAPDYTASDEAWTTWAGDNRSRSGIAACLILLGGVALLHFAGTIRSVLESAETTVRGSGGTLAHASSGGALVGITGIVIALVTIASATSEGSDVDPVAIRAVTTASAGPYLVAAMGFATLLGGAGLSTLRSGSLPRWTAVVALLGAAGFLITFLTPVAGLGENSVFGYGFLPGILALAIWSIATSLTEYRAVTTSTREPGT